MRKTARSDIAGLLQEARAIEMLATEADIGPAKLQDYWSLSTDLMVLVTDIEDYESSNPGAGYDDPTLFTLKSRLRAITSRLMELRAVE